MRHIPIDAIAIRIDAITKEIVGSGSIKRLTDLLTTSTYFHPHCANTYCTWHSARYQSIILVDLTITVIIPIITAIFANITGTNIAISLCRVSLANHLIRSTNAVRKTIARDDTVIRTLCLVFGIIQDTAITKL